MLVCGAQVLSCSLYSRARGGGRPMGGGEELPRAEQQVLMLRGLVGGQKVTIRHPNLPRPIQGEFVQLYDDDKLDATERPAATVFLFDMDEETGIPEEEHARFRELIRSQTVDPLKALVVTASELSSVDVQVHDPPPPPPTPMVTCPKCYATFTAESVIDRLGLCPASGMTAVAREIQKKLMETKRDLPFARQWAQQGANTLQFNSAAAAAAAVMWVDMECRRRESTVPPGAVCETTGCDFLFGVREVAEWLDDETRTLVATEASRAAAAKEREKAEEAELEALLTPTRSVKQTILGAKSGRSGADEGDENGQAAAARTKDGGGDSLMHVVEEHMENKRPAATTPRVAGVSAIQHRSQAKWGGFGSLLGASKVKDDDAVSSSSTSASTSSPQWLGHPPRPGMGRGVREKRAAIVKEMVGMGYDEQLAKDAVVAARDLGHALDIAASMGAEQQEKEEQARRAKRKGVFEFDGGDDKDDEGGAAVASKSSRTTAPSPKRVEPERGVLRSVLTLQLLWAEKDATSRASIDLNPDHLPSWEDFQSECAKELGLDPETHFVDGIERVNTSRSGRVLSRYEVHNFKDLLNNLESQSCVEVRTVRLDSSPVRVDNVGEEEAISTLLQEFHHNSVVQKQISELSRIYPRWRRIRGDGNCYYRAVMFGLCEKCLVQPQRMKQLKDLVKDTVSMPSDMRDRLLSWLEDHAGRLPLEEDFTDTNTGVDVALVTLARHALSSHIRRNRDVPLYGGLSMQQMVEAEDMTLDQYCQEHIEKIGVDAEGFQLDLGLLPGILGITCHTWMVQRNTNQLVQITRPIGAQFDLEISLLFVPGHYSFLVPAERNGFDAAAHVAPQAHEEQQQPMQVDYKRPDPPQSVLHTNEAADSDRPQASSSHHNGSSTEMTRGGGGGGTPPTRIEANEEEEEEEMKEEETMKEGGSNKAAFVCAINSLVGDVDKLRLESSGPCRDLCSNIIAQCRHLAGNDKDGTGAWKTVLDLCDEEDDDDRGPPTKTDVTLSKWLVKLHIALKSVAYHK